MKKLFFTLAVILVLSPAIAQAGSFDEMHCRKYPADPICPLPIKKGGPGFSTH